jgi:hypothetical protein
MDYFFKSVKPRVSLRNAELQNSAQRDGWRMSSWALAGLNALVALTLSLSSLATLFTETSISNKLTKKKEFILVRPVQGLNLNRPSYPGFEPEWPITTVTKLCHTVHQNHVPHHKLLIVYVLSEGNKSMPVSFKKVKVATLLPMKISAWNLGQVIGYSKIFHSFPVSLQGDIKIVPSNRQKTTCPIFSSIHHFYQPFV